MQIEPNTMNSLCGFFIFFFKQKFWLVPSGLNWSCRCLRSPQPRRRLWPWPSSRSGGTSSGYWGQRLQPILNRWAWIWLKHIAIVFCLKILNMTKIDIYVKFVPCQIKEPKFENLCQIPLIKYSIKYVQTKISEYMKRCMCGIWSQ